MTRKGNAKRDQVGKSTKNAESGGWTANIFDDEEDHGKRLLWSLATWAVMATLAVASAAWINHTASGLRRERLAYAELSRQADQLRHMTRQAQAETKRLASAVDVLDGDRDRLFARVTSLEQGLDSVTGSIAKQAPSPAWPSAAIAPVLSLPPVVASVSTSVATTSDEPATANAQAAHGKAHQNQPAPRQESATPSSKPSAATAAPIPLHPDAAFDKNPKAKPQQLAALSPPSSGAPSPPPGKSTVEQTNFAVDLGSAKSVEGLRALWRSSTKGWPALVGALQPLIAVKEGHDGLGLRLHLIAGPLRDAAAAAKLCANLVTSRHACEPTVFDGQRLSLHPPHVAAAVVPPREKLRRKPRPQPEKPVEQAPRPQAQQQPQPQPAGLLSLFGRR